MPRQHDDDDDARDDNTTRQRPGVIPLLTRRVVFARRCGARVLLWCCVVLRRGIVLHPAWLGGGYVRSATSCTRCRHSPAGSRAQQSCAPAAARAHRGAAAVTRSLGGAWRGACARASRGSLFCRHPRQIHASPLLVRGCGRGDGHGGCRDDACGEVRARPELELEATLCGGWLTIIGRVLAVNHGLRLPSFPEASAVDRRAGATRARARWCGARTVPADGAGRVFLTVTRSLTAAVAPPRRRRTRSSRSTRDRATRPPRSHASRRCATAHARPREPEAAFVEQSAGLRGRLGP